MTQTAATTARNTFDAADVEVTVNTGGALVIEFTDDNPSRVATVRIGRYGAARLLEQLAEQLGAWGANCAECGRSTLICTC
jgi:hypothetical protein